MDRNQITDDLSKNGSQVLNLYLVADRKETTLFIVAATGSENALQYITDTGVDWELSNTVTRRVQRNIETEEGVIDAIQLGGRKKFRANLKHT